MLIYYDEPTFVMVTGYASNILYRVKVRVK